MNKIRKSIGIIFLFLSINLYSQAYTVTKIGNNYEINFVDEFADQWYLNGELILMYGELS